MKLSKYVKCVQYDSKNVILHNMYNGAIYFITKDKLNEILEDRINEHYNILFDENFLVEKENVPVLIRENKFIALTIEVSNVCNLNCTYCYEKDKATRTKISQKVINAICEYVTNIFIADNKVEQIGVRFIGGETLLEKETVLNICARMNDICGKYNKKVNYIIDTNGTIDFSDLYKKINNLKIAISLSCEEDHNENRPSKNFDSFHRIVQNIKKVESKKLNSIEIRYNTNENNIDQFEEFVKFVKEQLKICTQIKPMYTDEYDYNAFRNNLSIVSFKKWNASKAIDILIKYGYPISYSLGGELTICESYQNYSCKVYSDGMITLCDSMFHNEATISIFDVCKNPSVLEKHFEKYRTYDPTKDEKCKSCIEIARCSGRLFCRNNSCDYNKRYDDETFLKTYIKHYLKGNQDKFLNM